MSYLENSSSKRFSILTLKYYPNESKTSPQNIWKQHIIKQQFDQNVKIGKNVTKCYPYTQGLSMLIKFTENHKICKLNCLLSVFMVHSLFLYF